MQERDTYIGTILSEKGVEADSEIQKQERQVTAFAGYLRRLVSDISVQLQSLRQVPILIDHLKYLLLRWCFMALRHILGNFGRGQLT